MQMVAEPWYMMTIGGSSFMVGLDAFALSGPGWLLTLWGGWIADRFNRKYVVIFFQFIQMLAVAVLIFLMYLNAVAPWMIIVASLISGITDSLSMPSLQTLVPSLVPKQDMPKAVSLNALQFNISRMMGPAIAGIVMAKFGAIYCFSGNLLSYFPLFFAVILIYPKKSQHRPMKRIERDWSPKLSDFTTLLKETEHLKILASVFFNGLFIIPMMVFVPVLVKQVLHAPAEQLGLVMGASGVGGLIGALSGFALPEKLRQKRNPLLFAAASGLIVTYLSANESILILGFGLMFIGILTGILTIACNSRLQMESQDQHRGRASSFFQLAMQGGMALGGLWTGLLAQSFGVQRSLLVNGILAIVIQLYLFFNKTSRSQLPSHN